MVNTAADDERKSSQARAPIGVVVIGRNEGQRLRRCLLSLLFPAETQPSAPAEAARRVTEEPTPEKRGSRPAGQPIVVYVDSGSTDGSVELAEELGAVVLHLDTSRKFTAARARNAGLWRLLELRPDLQFVQFVDGDCEIAPQWLHHAAHFLLGHPEYAVACGRRRELHPDHSIYNRLCDLEWETPVGDCRSCGGDALMRVEALRYVAGYRESLIAGEEPEMCFRMRQAGYRIMRLDQEMTRHDAAMFKATQWFQRSRRAGHASAEMAALHGSHPERPGVRSTASHLTWGLGFPAAVAITCATWGPLPAWTIGTVGPASLFYRSYRHERRRRSSEDARLYAASCVLAKVPAALGALTYYSNRILRRQSTLVEYKIEPST